MPTTVFEFYEGRYTFDASREHYKDEEKFNASMLAYKVETII